MGGAPSALQGRKVFGRREPAPANRKPQCREGAPGLRH